MKFLYNNSNCSNNKLKLHVRIIKKLQFLQYGDFSSLDLVEICSFDLVDISSRF